MLSQIFVYGLLAYICFGALKRPHIGVIGYYGFILLQPEWNWRWIIPSNMGFQKYIVAATLIGFMAENLRGNHFERAASRGTKFLGLFLALAFLSLQQSIAPTSSWFYIDIVWKMVMMAVIGVRVINTPARVLALLWVLMLSQGYNAYQITDSYFEHGRCLFTKVGFGFSGDNNLYCILTVPIMGVSVALSAYSQPLWQKVLAAVILVLQMHQLMLMESRGCMLGAILMLGVSVWFIPKTRINLAAIVCCAICGSILAGPAVVREFMSSFASEEERDSSAESRFALWKAGYAICKDYPLLGVGPYAGQYLVPHYLAGGRGKEGMGRGVKGLHNLFFEVGSGCGVPALLCYLTFFASAGWACFRLLWRQNREPIPDWLGCVSLAVFPGLIGYMASSMFSAGALLESSYALAVAGLAGTCVWAAEKRRSYGFSPQLPHFSQETLGIPQVPGKLGRS